MDDGSYNKISTPTLIENIDSPPSSGNGDMAESIPGLLFSLSQLVKSSLSLVSTQGSNSVQSERCFDQAKVGDDMKAYSTSLAARTTFLSDAISAILRSLPPNQRESSSDLFNSKQLRQNIISLKSSIASKQNTVKQLSLARDQALNGKKRALRALNRIAAGANISEVLKVRLRV